MGWLCDHDWQPATGMDSGSFCPKCGDTSSKECEPGSGLSSGVLLPKGEKSEYSKLLETASGTPKTDSPRKRGFFGMLGF